MRFIDKKLVNQPKELIAHKKTSTPAPTYDNFRDKDVLREALLKEQGFICGYCMRKIENDSQAMSIEHYREQCNFPKKDLDFDNMLAVCSGYWNNDTKNTTCDTKRGSFDKSQQSLTINPFDKNQMAKIQFSTTGKISIDDPIMQEDLDEKLNLNHDILVKNRKKAIALIMQIVEQKFRTKTLTKVFIQQQIDYYNTPNGEGQLQTFCQIFIYWLKKQERKAI